MSTKINTLEIENVKRVKAVKIDFTGKALTVIGGNNANGKTSVLEAIAWILGGNKYALDQHEGSVGNRYLKATLSNGVVVERKGKNGSLTVTDPSGKKAGQALLDSFIEGLALNLPKFLNSNDKEKARTLLNIIGLEKELKALDVKEDKEYNERLYLGQDALRKKKFAEELTFFDNVPEVPVDASELIKQQQDILAKNGENQRLRGQASSIQFSLTQQFSTLEMKRDKIAGINRMLNEVGVDYDNEVKKMKDLETQLKTAQKSTAELQDENTDAIEQQLRQHEEINSKVRANLDKLKAEEDSKELERKYNDMSSVIDQIREDRLKLLEGADMPLPELSVEKGALVYKGQTWSNMSGSEQLMVATAIVRKLNPECGFVLLDKLEQMDGPTLEGFGQWLEKEGLQAIATRVSTGEECSIIIEDGLIVDQVAPKINNTWENKEWKK